MFHAETFFFVVGCPWHNALAGVHVKPVFTVHFFAGILSVLPCRDAEESVVLSAAQLVSIQHTE